jgi:hypothetical protein
VTDQLHVILRRFDEPDEVRTFEKGRFELVCIHGMTIDRATYEPGWRWSEHVGTAAGQKSCRFEHIGMIVSGRATAAMDDASSRWGRATSSTSHRATTAGSSATSPTFRCTSSALNYASHD